MAEITNTGNFGKSDKGEVSKRGQGAQDEQAKAEAEAAKKASKKGKDE